MAQPATTREIRRFGLVGLAFAALLGGPAIWKHSAFLTWVAVVFCCVGALAAALPSGLGRRVYVAWMAVAGLIGGTIQKVILSSAFFAAFLPMALVYRLIGRDPMRRRFDPTRSSYWEDHTQVPPKDRYLHPF